MNKNGPRPTRVLIALYYYHPYVSGLTVYAKWVAEGLVERGYEVTVITSRHDKALPKREIISGVEVIRKPVLFQLGKGVIMPTFWLGIVSRARKNDYVNVQLPMAESGLSALFIPRQKLVSTYHCDLYLGRGVVDRTITFVSLTLMKLQLKRSRVVVANTRDYFEHSQMKGYLAKLTPVYPPVPRPQDVADVDDFYKRIGVKSDETKVGFVGRIVYEKGIEYLLQAIPYIRKDIPNFKIILMGDYEKVAGGGIRDQLDQYMAKYPDHILFTGFLDDADRNRFYAGLDVFVLPSIDPLESFGIVQVEAMLGGSPVVASDMPGVREVVRRTGYGRISKIKDPLDIAQQILEVVKNPSKYKPRPDEVAKLFNPDDSLDDYEKLMPKLR